MRNSHCCNAPIVRWLGRCQFYIGENPNTQKAQILCLKCGRPCIPVEPKEAPDA